MRRRRIVIVAITVWLVTLWAVCNWAGRAFGDTYSFVGSMATTKLPSETVKAGVTKCFAGLNRYFERQMVYTPGRADLTIGVYVPHPSWPAWYRRAAWYGWPTANTAAFGIDMGGTSESVLGTCLHEWIHFTGGHHGQGDRHDDIGGKGRRLTANDVRLLVSRGWPLKPGITPEMVAADTCWGCDRPELVLRPDTVTLKRNRWYQFGHTGTPRTTPTIDPLANDTGDDIRYRFVRDPQRNKGPHRVRHVGPRGFDFFTRISAGRSVRLLYYVCDVNGCPKYRAGSPYISWVTIEIVK